MVYFAQYRFSRLSYLSHFSFWITWPLSRPICEAPIVLYAAVWLMREPLALGAQALVLEKHSQVAVSRKLCLSELQRKFLSRIQT